MKEKTIRIFNLLKMLMAIPVLFIDLAVVLVSFFDGSVPMVLMFLALGWITYDYIKLSRAELKAGSWYELKKVE